MKPVNGEPARKGPKRRSEYRSMNLSASALDHLISKTFFSIQTFSLYAGRDPGSYPGASSSR